MTTEPDESESEPPEEPVEKSVEQRRREARQAGEEKGAMMREYLYTSTTGMEVGVGVAMGALGGWWLDGKYGTGPWGMLGGLTLGILHATRRLYGLVKREMAKGDDTPSDSASSDVGYSDVDDKRRPADDER